MPLRFTRLKVQNWRNFPAAELRLAKRCFLVGPNASGKSNLLDVFRFLADIAAVQGGGLPIAVDVSRSGMKAIRSLAARRVSDVVIEVDVGNDDRPALWTYRLQLSNDKQGAPVVVKECVLKDGQMVLDRPDAEDQADPARLTRTHLEQVNSNLAFRELADFLATTTYLHVVPQLVREPDRSVGKRNDPFGGDFLERLAKAPARTRESRLARITSGLKIAVPQLELLEMRQDERGRWHLAGKYAHWRAKGAWQTEERFSDGTLRLLGLLWAVLEGGGPLLLEEPELSLHADVARHIPAMFARMQSRSGRQVILSTHSEALLADEGIGLNEVFLLRPTAEGTEIDPATSIHDAAVLLSHGTPLGEIVLPRTRPDHSEQLGLFGA